MGIFRRVLYSIDETKKRIKGEVPHWTNAVGICGIGTVVKPDCAGRIESQQDKTLKTYGKMALLESLKHVLA